MDANAPGSLLRWFGEVDDPRPGRNVMHRLSDMLAIAILAVLCGAESWVEVATWGRCKRDWLRTFLPLPHGIPSHDTLGRVFGRLDPVPFERCFMNWMAAIHMISAWSQENQLVLGQLTTDEVAWYAEASQWKGLARFICIEAIRQVGEKRSVEQRYYLSSLRHASAECLLQIIRGH